MNHEENLTLLAKSIHQLGMQLPRMEILSILYPTQQMRIAVECLYSCVMEFLLRSHEWLNESRLHHLYHSVTRPHALHFDDVLARVKSCSNDILELASVGSQAEIRVMHETQTGTLEGIKSIVSRLEASEKHRNDQLDSLADSVSRLKREYKEDVGRIVSLIESSGLTINDLLSKVESEYVGGSRLLYRICLL